MPRQPALRLLLASTVSCGSAASTSARPASARTWSGSSSLLLRFGELPSRITSSHSSRSISLRCPRSASRSSTCSWCSLTIVGILVLLKDLDFVLALELHNRLEERSQTQVDAFLLLQTKPNQTTMGPPVRAISQRAELATATDIRTLFARCLPPRLLMWQQRSGTSEREDAPIVFLISRKTDRAAGPEHRRRVLRASTETEATPTTRGAVSNRYSQNRTMFRFERLLRLPRTK